MISLAAIAILCLCAWIGIRARGASPARTGGADGAASRARLLEALGTAYPRAVLGLLAATLCVFAGLSLRRRLPSRLRPILARGALAGATAIACVGLAEGGAAAYLSWQHRAPRLAMAAGPPAKTGAAGASDADASILVVGESSAEGVPYRDWLSVGKVVTWQLRRLFPTRMFHLEVQARAGWTLEQMHQKLAESSRRPDLLILYAGHNEFASRYGWSADVPYYDDDPGPGTAAGLATRLAGWSPLCRLMDEARGRALVASRPPIRPADVVTVPSHTAAQHQERLDDFRRRLGMILADLERAGVLTVVVVPPGNDAGFEPSRSVLLPGTPRADRDAFAAEVLSARELERADEARAIESYRRLIARYPGFAETHFRLARLLQRSGARDEAYREYVLARDLDAHPMRCPSAFQDVYRELAPRHGALLVDGQDVLRARAEAVGSGQLDDILFNDAMHPSLDGHMALAEAILSALRDRGAFGWPQSLAAPAISREACADHFDVTAATWKEVCRFASGFYRATLPIRFDPAEREAKAVAYESALKRLEAGETADALSVRGVGVGRPGTGPAPHR
ncbi:hypothetical protein [Aquisphaera giovannonii]|uniref:hypothetical protein n=1 Tax=Aquisphaera giovannonii TaxID=406548 RepID=UPI0011DF17FA|nr:hypothetical protein [Aquisphaera giovannonii]